jgi:hypothetical protein
MGTKANPGTYDCHANALPGDIEMLSDGSIAVRRGLGLKP